MPKPTHIAETSLYVNDLERAATFYMELFAAEAVHRDLRLCALRISADQMLLLFLRSASVMPTELRGGTLPGHDGAGPLHVCFGIRADDVPSWEDRLTLLGVAVESRMRWPGGAMSLYFRDPDGHAVELATPGVWA